MKNKLKFAAAILAASLTTAASAGVVTEWSYDNQAGFLQLGAAFDEGYGAGVTASGDSSTGSGGNVLSSGALPTDLSWGNPAWPNTQQSSLNIESAVLGNITTGGWAWEDGTDITHNNFVITGNSLVNGRVLDGLTLTPSSWSGAGDPTVNSPFTAPELSFGINFYETPNGANPCANGEANYSGDNVNGCGDIFEITGLDDLGITPVIGPDFVEFTVPFFLSTGDSAWDSVEYFITTRLSGLTLLPDGYECQDTTSCFGFVTKEKTSNVLQAQFKITTVPEPTAIALFGLGLLATGFAGRRKRNIK